MELILEYSKEQGCWHYNLLYDGIPEHAENTNTYESIGRLSLGQASRFTMFMDGIAKKGIIPKERWDTKLLQAMCNLFIKYD